MSGLVSMLMSGSGHNPVSSVSSVSNSRSSNTQLLYYPHSQPTPDAQFDNIHLDISLHLSPYLHWSIDTLAWSSSFLLTSQQRQLKLLQAAGSQNLVFHLLPQLIEDISLNQELRKQLMQLLGSNQVRATAYHPIANGLNESFQHLLKASLKSHLNQTHWIDFLTKVLLGICTALKDNIKLQYGRTDVRHYFTSTW